jgi:lipopolysaccharide/colanic/teichoic acid biosynthesis glycosyltransferase
VATIRPCVLEEEIFKGVLIREAQRAERSDRPLVLLVVTLDTSLSGHERSGWEEVTEGLTAAMRETDLVGWLQYRGALAVVLTDIRETALAISRGLESRLQCALTTRLGSKAAANVSVRLYAHPTCEASEKRGTWSAKPLLDHIRHSGSRVNLNDRFKRWLDVVGSVALLISLSPLFLLIACAVKLRSPGPVFYRQMRIGHEMKPFTMLKFRTMQVGADPSVHQQYVSQFIRQGFQATDLGEDGLYKLTDDARVTRVGRFLRKTSLDELPQFWNVLRGEMSLVGPRPPLAYEVEHYQTWHLRRLLEAKPGITGLWQVTGRSTTTFDDMVRLDLRYARSRSVWADVQILLATPGAVIAGKGAC